MKRLLLFLILYSFLNPISSQSNLWQEIKEEAIFNVHERNIIPQIYRTFKLESIALQQILEQAPAESMHLEVEGQLLKLPHPDGEVQRFQIYDSPVMEEGLAKKYPQIKTYIGKGIDDPTALTRLDITQKGFHAIVHSATGTWYIDPYFRENTSYYISYHKKDYVTDEEWHCSASEERLQEDITPRGPTPSGTELRTYRVAVAATGEYTQFHGGKENALAAIITTINRVTSVYERDLSVRMVLVEKNDTIIFTNPSTDPYDFVDPGESFQLNQSTINARIGDANYDFGHLFDRTPFGGGIAFLEVICSRNRKAWGYTALANPEGDPFDIDFVAHEMGHQFGGSHTFNGNVRSCSGSRSSRTAFEPGSGTTIMAYAGICGSQNVQDNSDDHFHVGSLSEIINFTQFQSGNNCAQRTPTNNTPPVIDPGPSGMVIPISTPFELVGSAVDAEGDTLTYNWEQFDLGPAGSPDAPEGNAPLFRSFPSKTSPIRVFPRIEDVINNTSTFGEILPNYGRNLKFRLTVRDNNMVGGGIDWEEISMRVSAFAGPFKVLSQADSTTWTAGTFQKIEWDVANTNLAPVEAKMVNIYLSEDGGFTYPYLLAENVLNTGEALVLIPSDLEGESFRVKVKAVGNVFFDINDHDIKIELAEEAGFDIGSSAPVQLTCASSETSFTVVTSAFAGFEGTLDFTVLGLPQGSSFSFDNNPVQAGDTINLTVTDLQNLSSGIYGFQVEAANGDLRDTVDLSINLFAGIPGEIEPISPASGELDVSTLGPLSWARDPEASQYWVQIATDPAFNNILFSDPNVQDTLYFPTASLSTNTTYYWRVSGSNLACGSGTFSPLRIFTTENHICKRYSAEDLPISFSNPPSLDAVITVPDDDIVRDVNVVNVSGNYFPISELTFQLSSPNGKAVTLLEPMCPIFPIFDLGFDEESNSEIPCPFNDGGIHKPVNPMFPLAGGNAQGDWTLSILHDKNSDAFNLNSWELEICFKEPPTSTTIATDFTNGLKVFPNPTNGDLNFAFGLEKSQQVSLRIVSLSGQLIKTINYGHLPTGDYQFNLDIQELPAGMYFYQLKGSLHQESFNGKLIVNP